ncbi:DegT/DnrJ/EryC1/StrS family aminotransferase [Nocardioides donggukensis]|uniref:DegT/DnrJ/EryC1/StrS family aminotransferase n=1 Tax=Nocardioides donggukensis TaxID=2774019 RepID=A0A927K9Z5_9ACTN|nr:DegT/DnrJ/EryC1/StrS family aminotransferase [Nocardioides donggukensis]MBD8870491.1 DegT/DnrJ/EryC1/StrS family aminotransferase [Nocardioides donggukensis]
MIPITRLSIGEEEARAAADVVRSGWLMNGPQTAEFERLVAEYVGAEHAVAVSSCTTALHLGLVAAGVQPGDEVICPSFSFIATANAIRYVGATPVFVDVDPGTFNIDPELIEPAITERTTAILPVSQIGLPADIPAIMKIAARHGLTVVEDAAPSFGATVHGQRLGTLSDITCFSFDARKILTTGEGGMVTTDDGGVADRIRLLRAHAASVSTADRDRAGRVILETYPEVGFNYKITDIQAAIGVVQMGRVDEIVAERRRLGRRYDLLLDRVDGVVAPLVPEGFEHVYQSYNVRLETDRTQEQVMTDMLDLGVATRRIFAIHTQPAFRRPEQPDLPVTLEAADRTILLPLFVGLTNDEQDQVVDALGKCL